MREVLRQVRLHEQDVLAEPRVGVLHVRCSRCCSSSSSRRSSGTARALLSTGATIKLSTYYVFSMAAFGLISACYTNIAISVSSRARKGSQASPRHAAPVALVPDGARDPRRPRRVLARSDHGRVSRWLCTARTCPTRRTSGGSCHAARRRGVLRLDRSRDLWGGPQRRRRPTDRERRDLPAAVPVRRLHQGGQQLPGLGAMGGSSVPGEAPPGRDARLLPRDRVPLVGRRVVLMIWAVIGIVVATRTFKWEPGR